MSRLAPRASIDERSDMARTDNRTNARRWRTARTLALGLAALGPTAIAVPHASLVRAAPMVPQQRPLDRCGTPEVPPEEAARLRTASLAFAKTRSDVGVSAPPGT